jgi:toxin FitB
VNPASEVLTFNVIDSSGWIEYFMDSPQADRFADAAEDAIHLIVPSISLYEVHRFLSRAADPALRDTCLDVMRRGRVVELTDARAIAASDVAQRHKLAMADAIHYAIAREFNATFHTQDVDYQGLPGVQFHAPKKPSARAKSR